MDGYSLMSLFLTYAAFGMLAYGADRRWGVATRGWCVDLTLPEPIEHHEGFLVGRPWQAQLFWSGALAALVAAASLTLGDGPWYAEVPVALAGAASCLGGIRLAQLLVTVRTRLVARRKAAAEAAAAAAALASEAASVGEPPAAPAPTRAELEASRIGRMNELLGRTG